MIDPGKDQQAAESCDATDGTEDVGYCKPPKHSQFKKGNKMGKGRPKGAKNLTTIVNEAMGQKVAAQVGGKIKKLSKLELTVHQLANQASQGNLKAADKVLALVERYGPQDDPEGPEPEKVRKDLDALRDFIAMQDAINSPDEEGEDNGDEQA